MFFSDLFFVMENSTTVNIIVEMDNQSLDVPHELNDLHLSVNDVSNILAYSVMSISK